MGAAQVGWYPEAVRKPLSNRSFYRMANPKRINLHTAVSNGTSLHTMFNRGGVASHFYIREDGTVEQYIPITHRAACDLQGNPDTISIETWDGYPNGWDHDSDVPPWTPGQVSSLILLVRWIFSVTDIPRKMASDNRVAGNTSHGLSWHRLGVPGYAKYSSPTGLLYSSSRGKVCPGNRRIAQILPIFTAAVSSVASPGNPGLPSTGDMPAATPIPNEEDTLSRAEVDEIKAHITAERRAMQLGGFDRAGQGMRVLMEEVRANTINHPIMSGGEKTIALAIAQSRNYDEAQSLAIGKLAVAVNSLAQQTGATIDTDAIVNALISGTTPLLVEAVTEAVGTEMADEIVESFIAKLATLNQHAAE